MIHVIQADGSDPFAISDPEGDAPNHAWSDDDALIAYQSDLGGDLDIYVYEVTSEKTRLGTDNDTADYAPEVDTNRYPQNSPAEEDASRHGALPSPARNR